MFLYIRCQIHSQWQAFSNISNRKHFEYYDITTTTRCFSKLHLMTFDEATEKKNYNKQKQYQKRSFFPRQTVFFKEIADEE